MKHKLLFLMSLALLWVGCSENEEPAQPSTQRLETPSPAITEQAATYVTLGWDAIEHATSYEYSLNGKQSEITTTEVTLHDLAAGTHTFKVRALSEDTAYTFSTWSEELQIEVADVERLATPVVSAEAKSMSSFSFEWSAIEGAASYAYMINEGEPVTTEQTSVEITDVEAGRYVINVRALSEDAAYENSLWSEAAAVEIDFCIAITPVSINMTDASVRFLSNDASELFFARIVTKAELEQNNVYGNDNNTISYLVENPNHRDYLYEDEKQITLERLVPGTDFVAVAFNYERPAKLFSYEFTTISGEVEDQFTISNIAPGYTDASFEVVPDDATKPWCYYVMRHADFMTYPEPIQNAYYGLYNLYAVDEQYEEFGDYLSVVSHTGNATISVSGLDNDTRYIAMIFYVDVESKDPTDIYDWNYTTVDIKTQAPGAIEDPVATITNPRVLTDEDGKYYMALNIKVNSSTTMVYYAYQFYDYFQSYYDQGWDACSAFFFTMYEEKNKKITDDYGEDAIEVMKSDAGLEFTLRAAYGKDDYGVAFQLVNEEGTKKVFGQLFLKEDFDNAVPAE